MDLHSRLKLLSCSNSGLFRKPESEPELDSKGTASSQSPDEIKLNRQYERGPLAVFLLA